MRSRIGDQLVYFGKHGLNIAFELEQYIERVPDHFCTEFIGIEQDPKWFDLSCRRIGAALKQPDFFVEAPKPAKQEAML